MLLDVSQSSGRALNARPPINNSRLGWHGGGRVGGHRDDDVAQVHEQSESLCSLYKVQMLRA